MTRANGRSCLGALLVVESFYLIFPSVLEPSSRTRGSARDEIGAFLTQLLRCHPRLLEGRSFLPSEVELDPRHFEGVVAASGTGCG